MIVKNNSKITHKASVAKYRADFIYFLDWGSVDIKYSKITQEFILITVKSFIFCRLSYY